MVGWGEGRQTASPRHVLGWPAQLLRRGVSPLHAADAWREPAFVAQEKSSPVRAAFGLWSFGGLAYRFVRGGGGYRGLDLTPRSGPSFSLDIAGEAE